MYEIVGSAKPIKQLKKLLEKLSPQVRKKLKFTLESNPYPNPIHGQSLCRIEKKGRFYCYSASGADRLLFTVIERPTRKVLIHFAGNDDKEQRFLDRFR